MAFMYFELSVVTENKREGKAEYMIRIPKGRMSLFRNTVAHADESIINVFRSERTVVNRFGFFTTKTSNIFVHDFLLYINK